MSHLRVAPKRTLSDLKRLVVKGATLTVVKSDTLPLGLTRTVTRTTSRGYYFTWTGYGRLGPIIAELEGDGRVFRGKATWPYARDVDVLNNHAYTVVRNGASITWSIKAPS